MASTVIQLGDSPLPIRRARIPTLLEGKSAMPQRLRGIRKIKESIEINAPTHVCYQSWIDQSHFPEFMCKVLRFESKMVPLMTLETTVSIQSALERLAPQLISMQQIKHWLIRGPGGKLYEFENKVVLDIPDRFYSTMSTDPEDLCTQASLLFEETDHPGVTRVELEVSFWESVCIKNGKSTRLASDILQKGDSFFFDCLRDFKIHVETLSASSHGLLTAESGFGLS